MQSINARIRIYQWFPLITSLLITTNPLATFSSPPKRPAPSALAGERHLTNIRQLTFGGENAEAYFSPDGTKLVFQSTREKSRADQIFVMDTLSGNVQLVSTGLGRCTCGYFLPNGQSILFSSTHRTSATPPPIPKHSGGYVWPVYPTYEIFIADAFRKSLKQLTHNNAYDAEATVCYKTGSIVFTSNRNGDLDLYTMNIDGTNIRRVTDTLGYDGGAFFNSDGTKICWRASRPKTDKAISDYKSLLSRNLVQPTKLELFIANSDGTNVQEVTSNNAANFCPFFTPDGQQLIFASNLHNPTARRPDFDLYLINIDGTGLERITFHPDFDAFPMFSPDGTKLVWASNRNKTRPGETNIFIADWHP